ncbi:hypothetical protein BD309DRAFT_960280 [Dichomitus squalens]|uniref:Uncharacterized protein n=1 Tax=Dichomitus squalens TaxID=114155 RepID=A0A4Q9QCR6_9APHY|nr:hypothetical protein BD309DRAFT_960280 [Dichomitus squalens]TBU65489.1 hypothetical protein BD310DRAFT_911429 [Dichomitus squalens]
MAQLRVVNYAEPSAFLEAMEQYDNSFMNSILGNLHDVIRNLAESVEPSTMSLCAIYLEDNLVISLAKPSATAAWLLCTPWNEGEMPVADVLDAVQLLCNSLLSRADSPLLGHVIAPDNVGVLRALNFASSIEDRPSKSVMPLYHRFYLHLVRLPFALPCP